MLFSFEIALQKFNSLIFNSAKSFCTYILPLTVNVEVVLLLLLVLFFAQEYTVKDSTNTIIII
jgi:hypothetical protein